MKAGGTYISMMGTVKKIDGYERALVMQDQTRIPIDEIVDITGEMFQAMDDFFA
jgi:phosphatidylglycerophosphatase A